MRSTPHCPTLPLPKSWPRRVRSGVIQVISLAHFSLITTRSWAANSWNARVRLKSQKRVTMGVQRAQNSVSRCLENRGSDHNSHVVPWPMERLYFPTTRGHCPTAWASSLRFMKIEIRLIFPSFTSTIAAR